MDLRYKARGTYKGDILLRDTCVGIPKNVGYNSDPHAFDSYACEAHVGEAYSYKEVIYTLFFFETLH